MDDVWREDDTTPGAVEAALRRMFAERHKEERAYVPARVMNMVVIVDREFRGEIENRLTRVGRYHPSRLLLVAVEPGRQEAVRDGADRHRGRAEVGLDRRRARARRPARRRAPPAQARHDRRPADRQRPGDDGVVAARPPGGRRRVAAAGADRADRLPGRVRRRGRVEARRRPVRRHLRRRSRLAALDAVARARGGRVRLAAAAAGSGQDLRRDRPPSRGFARLRPAVLRLARLAAGLGAGRAVAGARALERARAHAQAGHQGHADAGGHELAGAGRGDDRARLRRRGRRSTARPAGCGRCGASATAPSARGP